MFRIEKIDKNNRQWLLDSLGSDVIGHVFAFYDVQYDLENTIMYVALENDALKGYILIYGAVEPQSIIMECEDEIAEELLLTLLGIISSCMCRRVF